MAYLSPFLAEISSKFSVNVPNLMKSGFGFHKFGSIVLNLLFFWRGGIYLWTTHPDPERLVNVQGWDQEASEFWRKNEEYTFLRCSI